MKFGTVTEAQLAALDLHLPAEPETNKRILTGKKVSLPKVYVGAGVWGHASWAGTYYPFKIPSANFRQYYTQQFNCIELNATHYTVYSPDVLQRWAASARGKDFKFCPKFPQQISHHSGFAGVAEITTLFLESVASLQENLGPLFLQLSEHYSPVHKNALYHYLRSLPKDYQYFLEVRHPDWLRQEREGLLALLQELQIGLVLTDTPGRRDLVHLQLTIPKLFLRFVGAGLHTTTFSRTDEWIQQMTKWLNNGLEEAYIMLHPGNDAVVPELATYWINGLNKNATLQLKPPEPLQPVLF